MSNKISMFNSAPKKKKIVIAEYVTYIVAKEKNALTLKRYTESIWE